MLQQREPSVSIFQRIKAPFTESGEDEIAAAAPHQRPVGEILRERREELRLDINDIGEILRIKPAFLAALEQSRPEDLPGPTYVIGFVRAYARHLGLDHDWVLARYKAESAGVHARPDLSLPVPLGERSVPGGPILLVALILAICGYGTWFYLSTGERTRPDVRPGLGVAGWRRKHMDLGTVDLRLRACRPSNPNCRRKVVRRRT